MISLSPSTVKRSQRSVGGWQLPSCRRKEIWDDLGGVALQIPNLPCCSTCKMAKELVLALPVGASWFGWFDISLQAGHKYSQGWWHQFQYCVSLGVLAGTGNATTGTTTFNHHNHSTNHDCMTELDAAWSGPIPIFETYPGMQRKAHLVKISKSTLPPVENWGRLVRSSIRSTLSI